MEKRNHAVNAIKALVLLIFPLNSVCICKFSKNIKNLNANDCFAFKAKTIPSFLN